MDKDKVVQGIKTETTIEAIAEKREGKAREIKAREDASKIVTAPVKKNDRGDRRAPRKGGRGRRKFEEKKEYEEVVVSIGRITKVVKGGRRFRFNALVVIGNRKGVVGMGTGKANEVPDAIKKAIKNAQSNLLRVSLVGTTIPHDIIGKHDAGRVFLKPAPKGSGIIAGGAIRSVMELAGINDVVSKSLGSNTKINMVRATFNGLENLRTVESVAAMRDVDVDKLR